MSTAKSVTQKIGDWYAAYQAIRTQLLQDAAKAVTLDDAMAIDRAAAIAAAQLVAVGVSTPRSTPAEWDLDRMADDGDPIV